jgi:hypothetical protein
MEVKYKAKNDKRGRPLINTTRSIKLFTITPSPYPSPSADSAIVAYGYDAWKGEGRVGVLVIMIIMQAISCSP